MASSHNAWARSPAAAEASSSVATSKYGLIRLAKDIVDLAVAGDCRRDPDILKRLEEAGQLGHVGNTLAFHRFLANRQTAGQLGEVQGIFRIDKVLDELDGRLLHSFILQR